jgi:hypothetical protein
MVPLQLCTLIMNLPITLVVVVYAVKVTISDNAFKTSALTDELPTYLCKACSKEVPETVKHCGNCNKCV